MSLYFLFLLSCRFATIASRPTVQNLITRLFVGRWSLRLAIWKCSWRRSATETRSSWGWAWTHRHPSRSWTSCTSTIGWVEGEDLWSDLWDTIQIYVDILIGSYFAILTHLSKYVTQFERVHVWFCYLRSLDYFDWYVISTNVCCGWSPWLMWLMTGI